MSIFRRLLGEKKFHDQLNNQSVRFMVEHVNEYNTEIVQFCEPGTKMLFEDRSRLPNLLAEFTHDPALGILHGKGKGHCFIRLDVLKAAVDLCGKDIEIANYTDFVRVIQELGYKIRRVQYVEFENE